MISKRLIFEIRFKVIGLIEGNEYEFYVMVENDVGVGFLSGILRLIKCRELVNLLSVFIVVKVIDILKIIVSLEWFKLVFDGGMEIIGYIIEMCKVDLGDWYKVNVEVCVKIRYIVIDL